MVEFVEEFLDVRTSTKKDEYLVKGLVELLDADMTIGDSELFYVCEDGSTMTKEQILSADKLCVPSFLLGLWHYVLTVVKDNTVGQKTYDEFCPKRDRSERVYVKLLGENSTRNIRLTYCDSPALADLNWRTDAEDSVEHAEPENEDDDVQPEQSAAPGTVINNNPFFLNISGGTNTVYGHVDKVEIKSGRSDVDE